MFFFFFDDLGTGLKISSEILEKCYQDIFFEKLYRDKYLNIKQITDSLVKEYFKRIYYKIPENNSKRISIVAFIKKILTTDNKNLSSLLLEIDKEFLEKEIYFDDLTDTDKKALITAHLIYVIDSNALRNKVKYVYETLRNPQNYKKLVLYYENKQQVKHGKHNFENVDIIKNRNIEKLEFNSVYVYYPELVELKIGDSIQNIEQIIEDIESNNRDNSKLYFRGHSNINYQLIPSIYRTSKSFFYEHILCEESMTRNPEEYESSRTVHLNSLKKMQHYGIPTRLLDITQNLLVALFFSVEANFEDDGELIIFCTNKVKYTRSDNVSIISSLPFFNLNDKEEIIELANTDSLTDDAFNNKDIVKRLKHEISLEKPAFIQDLKKATFKSDYVVISTRDNRRIVQQAGAFIICSLNQQTIDNVSNLRVSNKSGKKIVIYIPSQEKIKYMKKLELYGINHGFIYPEIEEVSEYLKGKYC
ncbi:FRG domain-containing protein [Carnobacterium maltaromaticum]|uniref:FRG domain-containing protein n=1 Tax=Carnobacterium maltaromaticum TaxID=2751 RepID=UPI001E17DAD2|nr:FRG domain-containing protein [Carnobacterium maltaromaticum]MCC4313211.1 hypothetical protein [Carnobacterium maltaromaticum]